MCHFKYFSYVNKHTSLTVKIFAQYLHTFKALCSPPSFLPWKLLLNWPVMITNLTIVCLSNRKSKSCGFVIIVVVVVAGIAYRQLQVSWFLAEDGCSCSVSPTHPVGADGSAPDCLCYLPPALCLPPVHWAALHLPFSHHHPSFCVQTGGTHEPGVSPLSVAWIIWVVVTSLYGTEKLVLLFCFQVQQHW